MKKSSPLILLIATLVIVIPFSFGLSVNYYDVSCPNLKTIIQTRLWPVFALNPAATAGFVRLMFHDCMVQGCDASILLDHDNSEMASSRNFAITMREEINNIKLLVEQECPLQVSCADIIVLAAGESVSHTGGPQIQIPLGRKDSTNVSTSMDADVKIPPPSQTVDDFISDFTSKGMSIEEAVAILGGHTLGGGHCKNIVGRLNETTQWNSRNFVFETLLNLRCPADNFITNFLPVFNDLTPVLFDHQYYKDIREGRGLFGIDSMIAKDARTSPFVAKFADDENYFFQVFSSAFVKLAAANVLTDGQGEVRTMCNKFNT